MNILIVEDDPQELEEVRPVCLQEDSVQTASTCQDAISGLDRAWPEVVISDAIFPARQGEYADRYKSFLVGVLLDKLREIASETHRKVPKVILISGAVEAAEHFSEVADWLRNGRLYDVVPKAGFGSWNFFRAVLAHRLNSLRRDVHFAAVLQNAAESFREMARCGIITQDPKMLQMWQLVKRHAMEDKHTDNAFISGEMGVGKELVAQAIARLKDPAFQLKAPFYPLQESEFLPFNCNIPEGLFLGEMFGTKRGAFNDAQDKPGLIEKAGNGVLFLDQFCSISATNQRQLLRVLEEGTRQYRRLGGAENKAAHCKFVIADTVSVREALEVGVNDEKRLIAEMSSRLKHGSITIPPLRDRRDDIPLLTRVFLDRFNPSRNKVSLEQEVVDRFYRGPWEGNVRALHDIVRGVVQMSDGCVGWAQVCRCFSDDVLYPEVGEEAIRARVGWRGDENHLKDDIRAHLNQKGRLLFDELERKLADPSMKLDLDPNNVYRLLCHLCGDRSRRIRASESLDVLGVKASQFAKVVRVLYESSTETYKKYHLVTMLRELPDGRALAYQLLDGLYA